MNTLFLVLIVVVILTCIWLNNLSTRIGIPTLLAFILLGIIFGNIGIIPVGMQDELVAKETCTIALVFIMFYGGFGTRWEAVKPVVKESALLASLGNVVTAGLTGLFCHFALGWAWMESFLLGAVVSSTDAASVFSILRSKKLGLKNNISPMLELESGSNDPAAYMITAVMISVMNGTASGSSIAWMLFAQIAFGGLLGWGIAKLAVLVLQRFRFATEGFDTLFVFAVAIASYALPDLVGGNGYLSAYIVGMILGNEEFRGKRSMVGFFDGLTDLMQVIIFFMLGLLAKPGNLLNVALPALAIAVFLLFIGRFLAVSSLLTPFRKYPLKQQAFVSFVGLRGAASIVFAIMAVTGVSNMQVDLFNVVFCIVLISITLQGSLIPLAAKRLDIIDKSANVMKNFNDYVEEAEMQFSQIRINPDSPWVGSSLKSLNLPGNVIIVLIIRGNERMLPQGDMVIQPEDLIIIMSRLYSETKAHLYEKTVKPTSRRVGHPISEYPGSSLVVMVRRGTENIIPRGDTILQAGDKLVILKV